ncbi:carboxymuconolactone decarboxylase family protein [Nonomuraea sp. LPB2021202275-12-8]|uniref:carboxymuconolactone decarboxylase family protein n=1 Tax=Nonomuraea sp. LPB2021202275-12-8 TaxID=3120159 RepID=UPI00300C30A2
MTTRIPPLSAGEGDEQARGLLDKLGGDFDRIPNIFTTFARHPRMFRRWLGLGQHLLRESTLPPREREIVILRTAALSGSAYEWAQHAVIGRRAGLTPEEIERISAGLDANGWPDDDRALLRAIDELHDGHDLSDASWRALSARWDTHQVMDFTMTVGFYTMTAMALNTFGVEVDPDLAP